MTPPPTEEIIREIADISLKGALIYLSGRGIHDFTQTGYEKIKKIIQDKQNEEKYAFVPDKSEITTLLELKDSSNYRGISLLIPNYSYIDLIRTGLLIKKYQESKNPKNNKRIRKIKNQIINRPNGGYLLKIANLPTTPYFSGVVDYMYQLSKEGYSGVALEEKFSEIVNIWESSSLFVESETTPENVVEFINNQIKEHKPVYFVLGMKSARSTVKEVIDRLDKDDFFRKKGYERKITDSEPGKVEITVYKKI